MDFTVENLCGLIMRSRLLTPDEVKSMYQRWQDEAKDAVGNVGQFTRWLAARQYLTEYQATLIAKGHADNFYLNQYKILERLGKGRMAGVYKAVHQLGQVVAIKVLPPSKAKDPQLLGRFQREAQLALKLKHANVVRTFQMSEANKLKYIVMEYLEGETLEDVLQRRKKLPPNEAVRILHLALLGLQHLHEQGMVHRDLKPANVMLIAPPAGKGEADSTLRAAVKILDIGLGRELFDESAPQAQQNMELTGEGVLLGTPDYLAPEQARDPRTIDIRADIYSLGCVLYHALTGQPPFPDKNLLNQMIRHATETPKPLKDFNPAIPDGLQQIMNWMLAKQPDQRYPTPERAAQALQMFLAADSEAPRAAEEAPQLRKYLTWLETGAKDDAAPPPPLPAAAPFAVPALPAAQAGMPLPAAVPAVSAATPPPATRDPKKGKRHKGKPSPVAVAAPASPAPVPLAPPGVDVELVPLPGADASPTAGAGSRLGLTRRDWILLGIGAGAVVFAVVIGMVLALMLRSG